MRNVDKDLCMVYIPTELPFCIPPLLVGYVFTCVSSCVVIICMCVCLIVRKSRARWFSSRVRNFLEKKIFCFLYYFFLLRLLPGTLIRAEVPNHIFRSHFETARRASWQVLPFRPDPLVTHLEDFLTTCNPQEVENLWIWAFSASSYSKVYVLLFRKYSWKSPPRQWYLWLPNLHFFNLYFCYSRTIQMFCLHTLLWRAFSTCVMSQHQYKPVLFSLFQFSIRKKKMGIFWRRQALRKKRATLFLELLAEFIFGKLFFSS